MRAFTLVLPVEYARKPLKAIDRAGMLLLARAGRSAAVPVVLMIEAMVGKPEGAGGSFGICRKEKLGNPKSRTPSHPSSNPGNKPDQADFNRLLGESLSD